MSIDNTDDTITRTLRTSRRGFAACLGDALATINGMNELIERLQKFEAERKTLKANGLNFEKDVDLYLDLTEAIVAVAEKIQRKANADLNTSLVERHERLNTEQRNADSYQSRYGIR
jgi:uncharacterized protein (UPF0335 family)